MRLPFKLLIVAAAFFSLNSPGYGQNDIDLTGYTKTFDDEFDQLSVTENSPKGSATWYYLPPYGAAGFYSSSKWDINAFHIEDGILIDEAWQDAAGKWHSGNLSSVDP